MRNERAWQQHVLRRCMCCSLLVVATMPVQAATVALCENQSTDGASIGNTGSSSTGNDSMRYQVTLQHSLHVLDTDTDTDADAQVDADAEAGAEADTEVDAAASAPACTSTELPVTAAAIRWVGLAGTADQPLPDSLVLQGSFDGAVRVSELQLGAEPAGDQQLLPLMLQDNALAQFSARAFGLEERAVIDEDGGFVCNAGTQPAGIVLTANARWDAVNPQRLQLQLSGAGEWQLAIADAEREQRQQPLLLGSMSLPAGQSAYSVQFELPQQSAPWTGLTLLCPAGEARLVIQELRVQPQPVPGERVRAAWFWSPALWQQEAERLFALAQAWNLQRLYISVPVAAGAVEQSVVLQDFVTASHARGLSVWPVLGDPRHVLESEQSALAALVAAFQRYNQEAPEGAALDGLQLDIEPHLLPGFALAQQDWRVRWLATVQAVQQQLDAQLPLDLVMPVWWGSHPDWGQALLTGLSGPGLSVTVMNYRTAPAALRVGAPAFLRWGQQQQVPVMMALEAGSVGPDEQRLHFARADSVPADDAPEAPDAALSASEEASTEAAREASGAISQGASLAVPQGAQPGELLLLTLGNYRVLALLDAPVSDAAWPRYRVQRESISSSAALTFAGDLQQLEAVAAYMEVEWRSWQSYAGLALHGLDEVLLRPSAALNDNVSSPPPAPAQTAAGGGATRE